MRVHWLISQMDSSLQHTFPKCNYSATKQESKTFFQHFSFVYKSNYNRLEVEIRYQPYLVQTLCGNLIVEYMYNSIFMAPENNAVFQNMLGTFKEYYFY